MSSGRPEGPNPFEGLPMFQDLARLFASEGPVNWEVARQVALWVSSEGRAEDNVDPLERIRLEQLLRVAELHVGEAVGLPTSVTGRVLAVTPVTRSEWARRSLEAYRPLLERLATALSTARPAGEETAPDPSTQLLGDLGSLLGPLLLGMQAGYMVGSLAQRALGRYDLPIPRPPSDELILVASNLEAFAEEWSLPPDNVRLWLCLEEVAYHAVLGRPHVARLLEGLIQEYCAGFVVDPRALEERLGDLDPTDPAALQSVLGNPETLLGAMRSPAQEQVLERIAAVTTVVVGYVDHLMGEVGGKLIADAGRVREAVGRRRAEKGEGERFVQRLLGLELSRAHRERGTAFVRGVADRAGHEGLRRLWESERHLPTAAELEAPGLWLARIELPEDD